MEEDWIESKFKVGFDSEKRQLYFFMIYTLEGKEYQAVTFLDEQESFELATNMMKAFKRGTEISDGPSEGCAEGCKESCDEGCRDG